MNRILSSQFVAGLPGTEDRPTALVTAPFNRDRSEFEGKLTIKIPGYMFEDTSRFDGPKVLTDYHKKRILDQWLKDSDRFGMFEIDFIPFVEYGLDNTQKLLENIVDLLRDNVNLRKALYVHEVMVSELVNVLDDVTVLEDGYELIGGVIAKNIDPDVTHTIHLPLRHHVVSLRIQERVVENFKNHGKQSPHKPRLKDDKNERIIDSWEDRESRDAIYLVFTNEELEELAKEDFSLTHEVLNTILLHEMSKNEDRQNDS